MEFLDKFCNLYYVIKISILKLSQQNKALSKLRLNLIIISVLWPGRIHASSWFTIFDPNNELVPLTHRHSRQGPEDSSTSAPLS